MRQPDPTELRDHVRRFAAPAVVLLIAFGAVSIWGLQATEAPAEQPPTLHAAAKQPGREPSREPATGRDVEDPGSTGLSIGIAQR